MSLTSTDITKELENVINTMIGGDFKSSFKGLVETGKKGVKYGTLKFTAFQQKQKAQLAREVHVKALEVEKQALKEREKALKDLQNLKKIDPVILKKIQDATKNVQETKKKVAEEQTEVKKA